jgi:hypothetical protein
MMHRPRLRGSRSWCREQLDMVVGARRSEIESEPIARPCAGQPGLHRALSRLFGRTFSDIFSGYRVFSRASPRASRLVARLRDGNEISVHALGTGHAVGEMVTAYGARRRGIEAALHYRDGWRIMRTILHLYRIERPVLFYGSFGLMLAVAAIVLSIPLAVTYVETGLVPRFPTAILATGLIILAAMSFMCGLILDTVVRGRREVRRLAYLALPAVGSQQQRD